jgi:hypothetical protein
LPGTTPNSYAPLPPGSVAPEAPAVQVRLELQNGLVLEGAMTGAALPGVARLGSVSIPAQTIRGLRLHDTKTSADDKSTSDSKLPAGPTATVILDNDDSLTVALQLQHVQVKTEWGTAIVELAQLRSLLMLRDDTPAGEGWQWIETDGRWRLKRAGPPQDAPEPASGDAAPRLPLPTPATFGTGAGEKD